MSREIIAALLREREREREREEGEGGGREKRLGAGWHSDFRKTFLI